jgi:hypothetical protein
MASKWHRTESNFQVLLLLRTILFIYFFVMNDCSYIYYICIYNDCIIYIYIYIYIFIFSYKFNRVIRFVGEKYYGPISFIYLAHILL